MFRDGQDLTKWDEDCIECKRRLDAITKVVLANSWIKLELGGKETYEEMLEALGIES